MHFEDFAMLSVIHGLEVLLALFRVLFLKKSKICNKISGNFLFDSFGSCLYGFDNVPRVLIKLQFEGFYQAFVNNLLRTIFFF